MNSDCIQIPGKIFYNMGGNQNILVIVDGPYGRELQEYLESFKRFIIVENNRDDIEKALLNLFTNDNLINIDYDFVRKNFSPAKISADLICGGIENKSNI